MENIIDAVLLLLFISALVAYLVSHNEAVKIEERYDKYREDAAKATQAATEERRERLEKLDAYNEACNMEPFCGEGRKP